MLPMDPSNVVKAVAHHSEIKGCHGGIVSESRTMWTTSTSETIPVAISKERYGEGKELHDQRPALTPVGHGEQNILTRLTMCFATRMDLTLRAKSNKTESQKPTSWPYSQQDVLSNWLTDQQDAITMVSTDVLLLSEPLHIHPLPWHQLDSLSHSYRMVPPSDVCWFVNPI